MSGGSPRARESEHVTLTPWLKGSRDCGQAHSRSGVVLCSDGRAPARAAASKPGILGQAKQAPAVQSDQLPEGRGRGISGGRDYISVEEIGGGDLLAVENGRRPERLGVIKDTEREQLTSGCSTLIWLRVVVLADLCLYRTSP